MPPVPSDARLDQAILKSVKDGLYPEDEEVLSAELPSSALESLEKLLQDARTEVEVSHGALGILLVDPDSQIV